MSSSWLTLISSASAIASSRICERNVFSLEIGDLGAVHVVLEAVLALEVAVHLVVDQLLRHRDLDLLEQHVDDLVARLRALPERLRLADAAP